MFRAFFIGVFSALIVLAGVLPINAVVQAQTAPNLQAISRQTLPSSTEAKIPDVAAANKIVAVADTGNKRDAMSWVKADSAATFGDPARLGDANGISLYANTAVSAAPNGVMTYAWISSDSGGPIFVRQRAVDGTLLPQVQAAPGTSFRAYVDVAATTTGTIVVVWSQDRFFRYSYSNNNGATWSGVDIVSDKESLNVPALSVGADNRIMLAFGAATGIIYAGTWNGTGFSVEQVSSGNAYEADPTIAVGPDGTAYVAWRRIGGGYYYAARQATGAWPASRLSSAELYGFASIASDESGNLVFAWADTGGGINVAYKTVDNVFGGPVRMIQGDANFMVRVAMNSNGKSWIHVAAERHGGSGLHTDYVLLSAQGAAAMSVSPVLEPSVTLLKGTTPIVGNKTSVNLGFSAVSGSPNQIRWRWNVAPTDTLSDSGGWQAATITTTVPILVPIAASVNTTDCLSETLYIQVRDSTTTASEVKPVNVIVDSQASGSVRAVNPYIGNKSTVFTAGQDVQPADLTTDTGASDGDPNYTRWPQLYLEVNGGAECSGLSQLQTGASLAALGTPFGIVNNFLATAILIPNYNFSTMPIPQSSSTVAVRVSDKVGNLLDYTNVITVDTIKPVLNTLTLTPTLIITVNPSATILADLKFSDIQVTDAYPGGYWGAWVTNSLTPVTNPLTDTALLWTPVRIPDQANPVIKGWSLASRLPVSFKSLQPNTTFYVYTRFLDGAGNPTDGVISQTITLANITLPRQFLPAVRR